MCERKLNEIKLNENYRQSFCGAIFKQFRLRTALPKLLVILFILLVIPLNAFSQSHAVFSVQPIINEVKSRYKLTAKDLTRLLPLINQENIEILIIYARFGESENGYSQLLWNDIIERRCAFEVRIKGKLTNRQESALRAVRTEMEAQILNILVEEYVDFLGDFLELDPLQFDRIDNLLYLEQKRKHQLLIKNLSDITLLQKELEKISLETDSQIEKILSPMQFRLYLTLSVQNEFIAE